MSAPQEEDRSLKTSFIMWYYVTLISLPFILSYVCVMVFILKIQLNAYLTLSRGFRKGFTHANVKLFSTHSTPSLKFNEWKSPKLKSWWCQKVYLNGREGGKDVLNGLKCLIYDGWMRFHFISGIFIRATEEFLQWLRSSDLDLSHLLCHCIHNYYYLSQLNLDLKVLRTCSVPSACSRRRRLSR